MKIVSVLKNLALGVSIAALAGVAYYVHEHGLPWDAPTPSSKKVDALALEKSPGEAKQVKLTPQAQNNLALVSKPLKAETFWRTIQVPGMVVDRPAHSDRGVVAPVTSVVSKVHHFPGDTVRAGDPLFTLRVLSETVQLAQSELFKNAQELLITEEQKKRLADLAGSGGLAEARIIELQNQIRRLHVAAKAYRQELQTRGFTSDQIDAIAEGKYVTEIVVKAPSFTNSEKRGTAEVHADSQGDRPAGSSESTFEVQDLKVDLGQQVQAGQTLGLLSNHQLLYIEGRAFRQETPLVERATKEGWPVLVEFMEETGSDWPPLDQAFAIRHVANTIDPVTRTSAFYLPLINQSRSLVMGDRTLLLWRYRPGQKVRLHIKSEKIENVFVLPVDAVVWEGPEAYVFRQNGDVFDRKPVRVVFQDRQHVVLANDGSVPPGIFVTQNGASQLNRVLKSQVGEPSGFHVHADGSVHSNH